MSAAAPSETQIQKTQGVALDRPAPNGKVILDLINERAGSLASVATKHLTPEKLLKMIGVAMTRVKGLGQCTPISVLEAAMTCSELGLSPGVLGEAYLIPYKNVCTLIIGYRGLMKLARRSGEIRTIQAEVVREGDEFHWRLGVDPTLVHIPKSDTDAPMTHAWALAKFNDGSFQFTVMRATEVEKIRSRSMAGNNGPWKTDTAEMWKKTALRRLCKMLPLTAEVSMAVQQTDETEFNTDDLGFNALQAGRSSFRDAGAADGGGEGPGGDEGDGGTSVGDLAGGVVETAEDAANKAKISEQAATLKQNGTKRTLEEAAGEPEKPVDLYQARKDAKAKHGCKQGKKGCAEDGKTIEGVGYICTTHDPANH